MRLLVTGGAGFIGSALVRYLIQETGSTVLNVDKLTYAGNLESLAAVAGSQRYSFAQVDLADTNALMPLISTFQPDGIYHLAAETHVDRSIDGPAAFVHSNVVGTYSLLECARRYWEGLDSNGQENFRLLHVSTDEVFGELGETGRFSEDTPYDPNSPYAASKAASDHFVRAWHRTYGLPVLVTNCSNNYGPFQFPEKLIPLMMIKALSGQPMPVYGDGSNIRDWLYVDDHVRALHRVMERGVVGETYTIGGDNEKTNLSLVERLCDLLDRHADPARHGLESHRALISFVTDRPGHDQRYAIDASKIARELDWRPAESFESGLEKTVRWYLSNQAWWSRILDGRYRGERIGLRTVGAQARG